MKRFTLITLVLGLLALCSCQKKELFHNLRPNTTKSEKAFIDLSQVKDDRLKIIASELNRRDSAYNVQNFFNRKYGTILWDNAIVKSRDRDILAFIPFTKSKEDVEGFIISKVVDGRFQFELYNKASTLINGFKEVAGKRNNYEIQGYFDLFNSRIYNKNKRPLLHIMQVRDSVARKHIIDVKGTGDVSGIFIKYSFPKSAASTVCYDYYESVEI